MLTVVTFLWGVKYRRDDVLKLQNGVGRNLKQPHNFICIADAINRRRDLATEVELHPLADEALCGVKGCFARLRLFDPEFQRGLLDKGADGRIVCMDLDSVVTGPLDALFNRAENFCILQGANAANPCPFNGSLWMLRQGAHPEIWSEFSLEAAAKIPCYEFPDDQGWFWQRLPNAAGWNCGPQSGVYAFQKPQWPAGNDLPEDARLVVFPGWRAPKKYAHLDWVKKNWAA